MKKIELKEYKLKLDDGCQKLEDFQHSSPTSIQINIKNEKRYNIQRIKTIGIYG